MLINLCKQRLTHLGQLYDWR